MVSQEIMKFVIPAGWVGNPINVEQGCNDLQCVSVIINNNKSEWKLEINNQCQALNNIYDLTLRLEN